MGREFFKNIRKIGNNYWLTIYHPTIIDYPGMAKHGYIQEDVIIEDELSAMEVMRKIDEEVKDAVYRKQGR